MRLEPPTSRTNPITDLIEEALSEPPARLGMQDRIEMAYLDGMLTACAIGPVRTVPADWVRGYYGGEQKSESAEVVQALLAVWAMRYNDILHDLERLREDYVPRFVDTAEPGEEIKLGTEWASGFVRGTQLRGPSWLPRPASVDAILMLIDDIHGRPIIQQVEPDISACLEDLRAQAVQDLGARVYEIYALFRRNGGSRMIAPSALKPSRNDPCPCGSGKKFKKCCQH